MIIGGVIVSTIYYYSWDYCWGNALICGNLMYWTWEICNRNGNTAVAGTKESRAY